MNEDVLIENVLIEVRDALRELLAHLRQGSTRITDSGEMITLDEVANLLGIDRSKAKCLHAAGELPPPIRLGARTLRWRKSDVEAWLKKRTE